MHGISLNRLFAVTTFLVSLSCQSHVVGSPQVLLVLAGPESEAGARFLSSETEAAVIGAAEEGASRYGLSLLHPLYDLQDLSSMQPADVSGRVAGVLRDASLRYDAETLLSGFLFEGGGQWQGDWLLLSGETSRRWSSRASSRDQMIYKGLSDAANILTPLNAPSTVRASTGTVSQDRPNGDATAPGAAASDTPDFRLTGADIAAVNGSGTTATQGASKAPPISVTPVRSDTGKILVRVAGISGATDYDRALDAFKDNPAVSAYEVLAAEPDAVIVAVAARGDERALNQALEGTGVMQGEPSGAALGVGQGISLFFRLVP